MSGQATPHRQAPIDLRDVIGRAADTIAALVPASLDVLDGTQIRDAREVEGLLRALLPQPELTCPNCGHEDSQHDGDGCWRGGAGECNCLLTASALPQVRDLLAAERDSKPTPTPGSMWNAGDPEPESIEKVWDCDGDKWGRAEDGLWRAFGLHPRGWADLIRVYGPLTDQPPAGTR